MIDLLLATALGVEESGYFNVLKLVIDLAMFYFQFDIYIIYLVQVSVE